MYSQEEPLLLVPGPTPVPPVVREAGARPMISHRGPEFARLLEEVPAALAGVFGTRGTVFVLPASGTGAMEAALVNVAGRDDRILSCSMGTFGNHFGGIARAFDLDVEILVSPPGEAIEPERLADRIAGDEPYQAVLLTHNETSTGVALALGDCAEAVRAGARRAGHHRPPLIVVDAVSSLGAMPVSMDRHGIDVVVSSSQKALMTPPGLGFVAVREQALKALEQGGLPRFYFDLRKYKERSSLGQTPSTPALSLWFGLHRALCEMHAEGLDTVYARSRLSGAALRAALKALDICLVCKDEARASDSVTAAWLPSGVSWEPFQAVLADEFNMIAAGGLGDLQGKIFRIGHMGAVGPAEMIRAAGAIEEALTRLAGRPSAPPGAAVRAARKAAEAVKNGSPERKTSPSS